MQLEKGRAKPVAFSVKTNVAFDGSLDDDSPVHGYAISFAIGDYLHVMERYDQNWWIGRKVQIGCDIGFIPSPAKLETLRIQNAQNKTVKMSSANKPSSAANLSKFLPKKSSQDSKANSSASNQAGSDGEMDDLDGEAKPKADSHENEPAPTSASSLVEAEKKKRGLLGGRKVTCLLGYPMLD